MITILPYDINDRHFTRNGAEQARKPAQRISTLGLMETSGTSCPGEPDGFAVALAEVCLFRTEASHDNSRRRETTHKAIRKVMTAAHMATDT